MTAPSDCDLLIRNGTVVTVNPAFDVIENGAVRISGDVIVHVGEDDRSRAAARLIDATGCLVIPGLVNTHTHLPMTLFRGLADDLPLMEWLNSHIFPAESRHISPETVRCGALLACAEMILSGTTTCCDGYFHEDAAAAAVAETGLRAVMGQGVIDFPAPGVPDPADNIRAAAAFAETWKDRSPLIRPSVFCHSPYACSEETLKKGKALAATRGLLFQIHAAETRDELNRFTSERGRTPVQYLDEIGLLDRDTLLVHAIWVDAADIAVIAARNAAVSVTTESEMKLASGVAPIPEYLGAGVRVGLGTDGCASNNDLDMFGEMGATAKLHKVWSGDPTVLGAETVLRMTAMGGADAIGLSDCIGSIEPGKQADIVILDMNQPHLTPMYAPASHLAYAARGADVRDVIVAGKLLLENRKLRTIDLEDVLRAAADIGKAIHRASGKTRP